MNTSLAAVVLLLRDFLLRPASFCKLWANDFCCWGR